MVKYGIASVLALGVDLGLLLLLIHVFKVNYLVAASIAFCVGLIVNFAVSHNRIFKNQRIKNNVYNFAAFTAIGVIGLCVNAVILWVCFDIMNLSLIVSKCISVVIVFFWNFLGRRQFLYQGHISQKGV